ncbi:sigma-54-dependent Fis family transcriptional regulator [Fusibacter sp. 3D3]|uniref:sigma-54 interaction domain-containing protein n=1 Tax=Fusibacter sp. 3D3 TaxID=1048380 RepID=UPI0008529115|nr:sigma 54-interacting transcriptional regulator [Fusibacter sp. 3D3]GAU78939.1 flagellar regulatory protein FleQ [Fusibacter sp. 3D3]
MKSIAVIIDLKTGLETFLRNNLKIVFENQVDIHFYYLNLLTDDVYIEEDVVLVMTEERAVKAQKYLKDNKAIIVLRRTVKEDALYPIFKIPPKTKVLVVNDTVETTLETVTLLYQIGIDHLNLIPYESGMVYEDINIAITPDVVRKVPANIQNIIDIGNRYIDMTSFIQIIDKLKITDKEITKKLIDYTESIITFESGIKSQIRELYIKNEQLDTVVNLSNEGIMLTSNDDVILVFNETLLKIFNIQQDIVGVHLDALFNVDTLEILNRETLNEELIEYKDKFVIINKTRTKYLGENYGYYYNFQEVTYIKTLEQNLRKKMRNKGFITRYNFEEIITDSSVMKSCIELAKKIANSDLTVFISGESGTGKELLAQSIHNESSRGYHPFIAANCAAFAENLLESELFGYEGGAFTGALKEGKAGMFELANNGSIFLDEIGDMPLSLQTRLLRVLQERQVMRIGSQRVIEINTRVIVATNKNLYDMVKKGTFREDLYYRINVLPLNIPPLRQRKADILPLLEHFIDKGKHIALSDEVKQFLLRYSWPGNIREVQNVAAYIGIIHERDVYLNDLPYYLLDKGDEFKIEVQEIKETIGLKRCYDLMDLILNKNVHGRNIGRQGLEALLKEIYSDISEGEIRRILNVLNQFEFVMSYKGRKGSVVTEKGKIFMEWVVKKELRQPN